MNEKVSLKEKQEFISEMNIIIFTTPNVDANVKQKLERDIKEIISVPKTKADLEQLKSKILLELKTNTKQIVEDVAKKIEKPKAEEISTIKNINTVKRDDGTTITSVQSMDNSITVKDSTYSGDMKEMVSEVIKNNPDIKDRKQLVELAYTEIQRRQKNVGIENVYKYDDKTQQQFAKMQGDGYKISTEYGIAVDNQNRITDLMNPVSENNNYENNDGTKTQQKEKPKVKTYKRYTGKGNSSAGVVDAMLVGCVTLYAGLLGLCSIFSKM